ncbi:LacI family DNA-binding transcriptional regulator [Rhizobium sp. Root708]|uniref:LacI family DNA-binding transcriptional regulator n=1 Tax=Rhizobium sp. Root708 TaxID=1736592 RepID=UPI000AE1D8DF
MPIDNKRNPGASVTLRDVADAAGVSKSTVSRILDERLPRSDSASATRVRQVAAELGYVRDISAANLRRGKTSTIGVLVPSLAETVMGTFYEALVKACQKFGQFAIVATTNEDAAAERHAVNSLLARGVDGLILTTARIGDVVPSEIKAKGVPYVLALRTNGKGPASLGDDELGGYLATRHLLDLGHRRIAIIAGRTYASSSVGRQRGYERAMSEAGFQPLDDWLVNTGFDFDDGAAAAAKLYGGAHRPTAIFAVNDNLAIGAMSWLEAHGLSVPADVSVVGYNDIPVVRHLAPPMTSVRVPFDHIASSAVELLQLTLAEAENEIRIASPTLIPRGSTSRL